MGSKRYIHRLRTDCYARLGKNNNQVVETKEPEFLSVVTRKPQVSQGGYRSKWKSGIRRKAGRKVGEEMRMEIMRFANAPLLFDTGGCGITEAVKTVDWKRYGIKDAEQRLLRFLESDFRPSPTREPESK